jgi:hypothetical protein
MYIAIIGRTQKETLWYANSFLAKIPKEKISKIIKKPCFTIELTDGTYIKAIPGYIDYIRGHRFDQCYLQVGLNDSILKYLVIMLSFSPLPKNEQVIFWE